MGTDSQDADRAQLLEADMDRREVESRRANNQIWNGAGDYGCVLSSRSTEKTVGRRFISIR